MASIIKVDQIQTAAGGTPTAADLGLNTTGSVLQVVQGTYQTQTDFNHSSYTDSGLSVAITPTSTTSKVLITCVAPGCGSSNGSNSSSRGMYRVVSVISGTTATVQDLDPLNGYTATSSADFSSIVGNFLHTPSTTSEITYKVQYQSEGAGTVRFLGQNSGQTPLATLTAMEIAG